MITVQQFVLALFEIGITVYKDTYAGKELIGINTGLGYHNVQVCFLTPETILVRHIETPGRDYTLNASDPNIVRDFASEEYDIVTNCITTGIDSDAYVDALERFLETEENVNE